MTAKPASEIFRTLPAGVELFVRLTPKSSADAVEGVAVAADGSRRLKVRVRAAPENGKANAALERLVASWLKLPKGDVTLIAGGTSRLKTLRVGGDPREVTAKIEARVGD